MKYLDVTTPCKETPALIILNGMSYIRKPLHVWKFGDWARIKNIYGQGEKVVFVTGPASVTGVVPIAVNGLGTSCHCDVIDERNLEYITTAKIPE